MNQNEETQTQMHPETQLAQDDLEIITIRSVILETPADPAKRRTIGVSPELMDMVNELRDTVKRIDPRRHTVKTLRRSLANVSDIWLPT